MPVGSTALADFKRLNRLSPWYGNLTQRFLVRPAATRTDAAIDAPLCLGGIACSAHTTVRVATIVHSVATTSKPSGR